MYEGADGAKKRGAGGKHTNDTSNAKQNAFLRMIFEASKAEPHRAVLTKAYDMLTGTPKGDIRHLVPDARAVAAMDDPAMPALLLFPRFGEAAAVRAVAAGEAFVRLTQASTNYVALGERGFDTLTRFARDVPKVAVDYPDGEAAIAQVEALWAAL